MPQSVLIPLRATPGGELLHSQPCNDLYAVHLRHAARQRQQLAAEHLHRTVMVKVVQIWRASSSCCQIAMQADACVVVVLAGLILMVPPLILMTMFDDDRTLGIHSEAVTCAASSRSLPYVRASSSCCLTVICAQR